MVEEMRKNRIKELRREHHMTQVRLAIALNVTQETISAYESGKHCPSVEILLNMSKVFNVSCDYIIGISEVRNPNLPFIQNEYDSVFYTKFKQMDLRQKRLLMLYMDVLLDNNRPRF